MEKQIPNVRTGKPLAEYECRDVDQFRRLTANKPGPGAPEGNANRLKHGIFANRFLSAEERALFQGIVSDLREDFSFNRSSDFIQVELVGMYFLKLGRALANEEWEASSKIDGMLRGHLKDLKSTKIVREGEGRQPAETTPAEWATALLEKLAQSEKNGMAETDPVNTQK